MNVYLKACGVDIASATVFAVIFTVAALVIPMWWMIRQQGAEGGLGAASLEATWTLLAALVGFFVGFVWSLRRARR